MGQSKLKQHMLYGLFGLLMGVILSASGFTNFTEVHKMFTFRDFHLLMIFAGAVGIAMVMFAFMAKARSSGRKHFTKGTIPGAVMFGTGWAITGVCPAVVLVQLGEGQVAAAWSLFGIFTGVRFYRSLTGRAFQFDTGICGEE